MSAPTGTAYIDPGQMLIPGLGPNVGERYRNVNTGSLAAVVGIRQGHFQWVSIRTPAGEAEITMARFLAVFERI